MLISETRVRLKEEKQWNKYLYGREWDKRVKTRASVVGIIGKREGRMMKTKVEREREKAKKVGDWDEKKGVLSKKRGKL